MMPDSDDPTYRDEFAHRQQYPIKDIPVFRQEVEKIVEELLQLEARTHPANRDPGKKELCSIDALVRTERLVEILSGWAIDHRAGMILNGTTVYPWPEDDQVAPIQANNHDHEKMGSAYLKDKESGDPLENRHIVAEITTRAAVLPAALRNELSDALRARDFGEIHPLLLPLKGQRKNAYTRWCLCLRAIGHVYFLWGQGEKTKEAAFWQVADEYGVTLEAVDSWDRSRVGLLKHFGPAVVKVVRETAKRSGEQYRRLQMQRQKSDLNDKHVEALLRTYGPEALSSNAQRFKTVKRRVSRKKVG
jgi:hypothetical protein